MIGIVLVATACSGSADDASGTTFTAPAPPNEFASGLTIGFIPSGYTWVWNEGHETAIFHVFQEDEGTAQLSVGVQISPTSPSSPGDEVTRGGRKFVVYEEGTKTRVTEVVSNDVRVDVLSSSLATETLLEVAESVTYQPTTG